MEAVYLLLRLKGMRESSKESWREMLKLGYTGHQNAVIVVFLVIEEISVLEDSRIVIENGFNLWWYV